MEVGFYLIATLEDTMSNHVVKIVGGFGFMLQTLLVELSHPPRCSDIVLPFHGYCKLGLGFLNWLYFDPTVERFVAFISPWSIGSLPIGFLVVLKTV
jgi:hypothetical protein